MRGKFITFCVLAVLAAVAVSGCIFKPTKLKGVISYRDGRVYLNKGDYYRVGILPEEWVRMSTRAKTISFYSDRALSSISTDAFCGRSVSNRKLSALAGDATSALEDRNVTEEKEFMLDGRGALRRTITGKQDGISLVVDLVVIKKDGCVFDIYSVSPPDKALQVKSDFETFFGGFHYGN